ncbi:MAG: hypothetical protein ACOYB1_14895 [Limnohabitans sp.]
MKKSIATLLCLSLLLVAGCATNPGDKPADEAPRLVQDNNKIYWNKASAFGPVPASLDEKAVKLCATLDDEKLTWLPHGFHPAAQDLQGNAFVNGGLLCKSEKKKS